MTTPQSIEPQHTPLTAVARLDELRTRESLAGDGSDEEALDRTQLLELLALSEVVARKATYGRRLTVRSAREAGASWSQLGGRAGHQQAGRPGGAPALDRRPGGRARPARRDRVQPGGRG
jgi:hypothetical protein